MSTAAAEKPAAEVVLPPAGNVPTPKQKEAFLDIFRKPGSKEQVTEEVKTVTEQTEAKAPKTEQVKETPVKTEVAKTEQVKEEKPDVEKNFAALRQGKEAAEKALKEASEERDRLKAQYEELTKKPAPEEFMKRLEATEKEKAEYQKRLREADLARDPEFNAKFDTPIKSAMQEMVSLAVAAGVDQKEATATVSAWNESKFEEWLDAMGPVDKLKFGASLQQAVTLYRQKEMELSQAEQTYATMQKQREEQIKQQREQYQSTLNADIESNLKELAETPLGKDHTELLAETRTLLRRAGGLEGERIDNKTLLGMVGKSLLLAKGFEKQEKVIAEKDGRITELEKTVAERDAFIKELNGGTPTIGSTTTAKKQDAKAMARSILNPVIA